MEALTTYLLQFENLNQQQIELVLSKAKELELKKDDYFSEAGKIARQVAFIHWLSLFISDNSIKKLSFSHCN